jgi:hypothetical protein
MELWDEMLDLAECSLEEEDNFTLNHDGSL